MGNRAVITTEEKRLGVYVHWNGGRDSIEAFLAVCKEKGFRSPDTDCYGWARLCQVIANFFPTGGSVGCDTLDHLDCNNGDNGVYIIKDWEIVGREHFRDDRTEQQDTNQEERIQAIRDAQPKPKNKLSA